MPTEGKGRLFKRKDGKFMVYIPKDLAEDSMFPFKVWSKSERSGCDFISVKVSFKMGGKTELLIEEWKGPEQESGHGNL